MTTSGGQESLTSVSRQWWIVHWKSDISGSRLPRMVQHQVWRGSCHLFLPSTRRVQSRRPENTSGGVSCIEISGYKMFMCELLWSSVWSILLVTILIHFKLPYMIKPYWQHLHDFFIVLLFVCCMFWSFSGKLGLACIWEELYFSIQTGFFQEKYKINPGVKVLSILDLWSIHL